MNATTKKFTQDLPPKGGFHPIQTERVPLRTLIGGNAWPFLQVQSSNIQY